MRRAASIFDRVVVAIAANPNKAPMFSLEQRVDMARRVLADVHNVEVRGYVGLTVDFARQNGLSVIVRGLRAVSDFEFEFQLANMSRHLSPEIESVFMTPQEQYTFISSTLVREIAVLGGNVSEFVHPLVEVELKRHRKLEGRQARKPARGVAPRRGSLFAALWLAALDRRLRRLLTRTRRRPLPAHSHPMMPRPRAAARSAGRRRTRARSRAPIRSRAKRGRKCSRAAAMRSMPPSRCPPRSPWSSPRARASAAADSIFCIGQSDGLETMVDAREKAPGAASRDMYLDAQGNPDRARIDRPAPRPRPFPASPRPSSISRATTASCP